MRRRRRPHAGGAGRRSRTSRGLGLPGPLRCPRAVATVGGMSPAKARDREPGPALVTTPGGEGRFLTNMSQVVEVGMRSEKATLRLPQLDASGLTGLSPSFSHPSVTSPSTVRRSDCRYLGQRGRSRTVAGGSRNLGWRSCRTHTLGTQTGPLRRSITG
jgi:hypothetical protein